MGIFSNLFGKKSRTKSGKAAPTPPTEDVLYDGCDPSCGYFITEFSPRTYEPVRRNGKLAGHCEYQNCAVYMGDHCKFADDHPDKLGKGIF